MLGDGGKRFRWSHSEEDPPIFGAGYKETETKTQAGTIEKTETKEETKEALVESEPEEEVEEDSGMEFLLACDDLESVISYNVNATANKQSYSLKEEMEQRQLNELFTPSNNTRVKISEEESKTGPVKIDRDTILDMESLDQYLKGKGEMKITIESGSSTNKRVVKAKAKKEEQKRN